MFFFDVGVLLYINLEQCSVGLNKQLVLTGVWHIGLVNGVSAAAEYSGGGVVGGDVGAASLLRQRPRHGARCTLRWLVEALITQRYRYNSRWIHIVQICIEIQVSEHLKVNNNLFVIMH